jgi:hypothetical protein
MRQSNLIDNIQSRESDDNTISLEQGRITFVQAQVEDIAVALEAAMEEDGVATGKEGLNQWEIEEMRLGVKQGLEDFYTDNADMLTNPITRHMDDMFDGATVSDVTEGLTEVKDTIKETSEAGLKFQKLLKKVLAFKMILIGAAIYGLVQFAEKIADAVENMLPAIMKVVAAVEAILAKVGQLYDALPGWLKPGDFGPGEREREAAAAIVDSPLNQFMQDTFGKDFDTPSGRASAELERFVNDKDAQASKAEELAERDWVRTGFGTRKKTEEEIARDIETAETLRREAEEARVGAASGAISADDLRDRPVHTIMGVPRYKGVMDEYLALDGTIKNIERVASEHPDSGVHVAEDLYNRRQRLYSELSDEQRQSIEPPERGLPTVSPATDIPTLMLDKIDVPGRRDSPVDYPGAPGIMDELSRVEPMQGSKAEKLVSSLTAEAAQTTIAPVTVNSPTHVVNNSTSHIVNPKPDPRNSDYTMSAFNREQTPFSLG